MTLSPRLLLGLLACSILPCCSREPGEVEKSRVQTPLRVAVAANFSGPATQLGRAFEQQHPGTKVELSSGSSGKLYAQIANGAPFDVFLSADADRPKKLETQGLAVVGSRKLYALGKLVLVGSALKSSSDGESVLRTGEFKHLAIANPDTAPYGVAAQQVLVKLGLWEKLQPRIVRGESITQAHQFVTSGSAELGFVALAQVLADKVPHWDVPPSFHEPIRQEAVLLEQGTEHPLAADFVTFLQGASARTTILAAGYGTE
jgi:molybdate transport system substrate-binding protein